MNEEVPKLKLECCVSEVCGVDVPDVEFELLLDRGDVDGDGAGVEDEPDEDCEPEYGTGILVDG